MTVNRAILCTYNIFRSIGRSDSLKRFIYFRQKQIFDMYLYLFCSFNCAHLFNFSVEKNVGTESWVQIQTFPAEFSLIVKFKILLGLNIRLWKVKLNIVQNNMIIKSFLQFAFFLCLLPVLLKTHQHIVWNKISGYVMYASILWPNIHAMSPNCSGLFLMSPFVDTCESKWQSCILFPESISDSTHWVS